MKYLLILAVAILAGCNEQESPGNTTNTSSDYVAQQQAKVMETLAQNTANKDQVETITATEVEGNRLYSLSLAELQTIYGGSSGRTCILLSDQLNNSVKDIDQDLLIKSCEGYSESLAYSFAELIDPKAIDHFQTEMVKATCAEQEKQVDGRFIKRAKACEQFYGSAE